MAAPEAFHILRGRAIIRYLENKIVVSRPEIIVEQIYNLKKIKVRTDAVNDRRNVIYRGKPPAKAAAA